MFTGIIEEVGSVRDVSLSGGCGAISISANKVLDSTLIGDSIAVNGVCLTVRDIDSLGFVADVMPETMSRTALGLLKRLDKVNLERAMPADGRFGGHIVSGHIDDVARIVSKKQDGNAFVVTLEASVSALRYIVEKGSVALNGISLTVVSVGTHSFSVSIIPHTMENTNLGQLNIGSKVNLECDVIAKYVERMLCFDRDLNIGDGCDGASGCEGLHSSSTGGVSLQFLAENGFDV